MFNIQKFSLNDGPGIRTSLFLSGCPLSCRWCSNPECRTDGTFYTHEALLELVLKDRPFYEKSGGGVTLTGGEVFCQYEFACDFCDLLHRNGIRTAIETSGHVSAEKFRRLTEKADFVFMDAKHYDSERHRRKTGVTTDLIRENMIRLVQSGIDCLIRIPVIPHFNDTAADAAGFAAYFREIGVKRVELLPFHQLGEGKYEKRGIAYEYAGEPSLHREDLASYRDILQKGGIEVILK